jgi:hypothetical protein
MNSKLLVAALAVLFFIGCNKFQPSYEEINTLQSEWLLPIAKTNIGFKNIKEISNLEFDVFVSPADLGFSIDLPLTLPNFEAASLGPYPRQLTNGFPFSLNAGNSVTFRNSPDNTNDNNKLF